MIKLNAFWKAAQLASLGLSAMLLVLLLVFVGGQANAQGQPSVDRLPIVKGELSQIAGIRRLCVQQAEPIDKTAYNAELAYLFEADLKMLIAERVPGVRFVGPCNRFDIIVKFACQARHDRTNICSGSVTRVVRNPAFSLQQCPRPPLFMIERFIEQSDPKVQTGDGAGRYLDIFVERLTRAMIGPKWKSSRERSKR